jgi:tetratricopeptide (TPR) repeat protein
LPSSEALAAAAAEALLLGSPAIDQETERKLRIYSSRLSEEPLKPVALGVHILLEDLRDPVKAETIPNKETLFSAVAPETKGFGSFDLSVDLLLLQILQGDIPGASARINSLLHDSGVLARRPDLLQLAAEFFYDFDAPLRAAELFAQSSDQRSLARQADSLWLSGYVSGSRNLWNLLLAPERSGADNADSAITARSLYNLAATTENPDEKRANLYNFMKQFSATGKGDAYYVYGLIYYSRLLEASHSIQVLETAETEGHVLLDLELLRRRSGTWTIEKSVAETWLLVNQYPDDPRIYQWGCYFFDLQRRYDETAELIRQAELRQIAAPWIDFHIALRLLREGRLNEGMERLNAIVPPHFMWQVPADIARIMEISHDPSGALEYYETAASLVKDRKSAAKILFRMSRCFRALGKEQESLYALEESLRFDPDYLDARLELQRRGLP